MPKILPDDVPMRTTVRDTQLAEQLVEVPTIVSCSWLQLGMEQNVDTPVPGRGGRIAGLQGFPSEQSLTALHVSQERISERTVEQLRFWLRPSRFSPRTEFILFFALPAGAHEVLDEPGEVFFRTFPQLKKKCEVGSALWVGTECGLDFIHPGSSCGSLGRWRRRLDPH